MLWRYLAERARMVREWRSWVPRVVKVIKDLWPDAEIYVIGSVARGEAIGSSDVDLLVVLENPPKTARDRAMARVLVEERAELPEYNPLNIHFISQEEKSVWLGRAKQYIRIA